MTTRSANMFADQTSIGKLVAHCPAQTECVPARLRLSHLLQSADFTPTGFPPQSILIVRHAFGPRPISLTSFRLGSKWENEVRENMGRLYRSAVRPVGGIVPAGAQAVLFADIGEWLACLGLAVQTRLIEQSWCWRACLRKEAISSSQTLVRNWTSAPRFVPAAVVHLAEWSCVNAVFELFSPGESNAILAVLANEWNLPKEKLPPADPIKIEAVAASFFTVERAFPSLPSIEGFTSHRQAKLAKQKAAAAGGSSSLRIDSDDGAEQEALWLRWLPSLERSCETLPLETQRLLAIAVALFHAPALARSTAFAAKVTRRLSAIARRQAAPVDTSPSPAVAVPVPRVNVDERVGPTTVQKSSEDSPPPIAKITSNDARATAESETEPLRFWRNLSGYQTRIGGVLFLLNLLQQTRLPECFDEELGLSRHLSQWSLLELLGKALLGPSAEDFHDDPVWTILQLLDGRAPGDVPGASLPELNEYRMPAEWLKHFVDPDEPLGVESSAGRLRLYHRSGEFTVVDCALDELNVAERADSELERFWSQGVSVELEEHGSLDEELSESFLHRLRGSTEWSSMSHSLRRWLCWTFPFLNYVLVRALAEDEDLGQLLLQKTGTLYCTTTHVDLVMQLDQIALPVRRASLDADPGWLPNLARVVSFHFE